MQRLLDRARRDAIGLDELDGGRTAGQRFETKGAAAREQVEAVSPGQLELEPVEHRLANAIGCGSQRRRRRKLQPAAAPLASDDPHLSAKAGIATRTSDFSRRFCVRRAWPARPGAILARHQRASVGFGQTNGTRDVTRGLKRGETQMFESRNRPSTTALAAALVAVALAGCSASKDGDPLPPPASQVFKAEFSTTTGRLPYPTDLFFAGSTDGTLNLPTIAFRPAANQAALNSQDGWSTSAPITASFSSPVNESSLTPTSVVVVEMYLSNTTKGPATGAPDLPPGVASPVIRVLNPGTDYTVGLSDDIDSNGRFIKITPLVPLRPSTGATNIGYLVILTDEIQDESGAAATPDDQYASYKSAPDDCSSFDPATQATDYGLCRLTKGHLQIAGALGIPPAAVVETWSFTTQSVDDTFLALNQIYGLQPAQPIAVVPIGKNTHDVNPGLQGKADIYVGFTQVPYYLTRSETSSDRAVLTSIWTAAGPSPVPGIDPTSRNLTRFNPVPARTADLKVPLIVTVPNATGPGGACSKPAAGWPVAVVQQASPVIARRRLQSRTHSPRRASSSPPSTCRCTA
jgi:hypothetical protein